MWVNTILSFAKKQAITWANNLLLHCTTNVIPNTRIKYDFCHTQLPSLSVLVNGSGWLFRVSFPYNFFSES